MSTDAVVTIERVAGAEPGAARSKWAEVWLRRDYELFDLLGGGRSGDHADACVPVRPVTWPGCAEPDPASTWLVLAEVEHVARTYTERTGRVSEDLVAILAALGSLEARTPGATRVVVRFF